MAPLAFLTRSTLQVTLEQDMVFVHPSSEEAGPSDDPMVRGTVLLSLAKRKAVKTIRVVLQGLCDAYGGVDWPYESTETLMKKLEVDVGDEVLEAGEHAFNFAFIIPSNTPVFQRSNFGRVRHYVKAYVDFSSQLRSNLSSPSVALWVTASPVPIGEVLEPMEIDLQHFQDDLGIISVNISSLHLTVSSLLHLRLSFLGSALPFQITSITGGIIQTFAVHYNQLTMVAHPAPRRHNLIKVDDSPLLDPPPAVSPPARRPSILNGAALSSTLTSNTTITSGAPLSPSISTASTSGVLLDDRIRIDPIPLQVLAPQQPYTYQCVMRVPCDDIIRPTTLKHTESKIRVNHRLIFHVRYRAEGMEEDKVLTIGKNVVIASCCCLLDHLSLPAYTKSAPCTIVRTGENRCRCNMSLTEMLDQDGIVLERAAALEVSPEHVRLLGVDRNSKSAVDWVDESGGARFNDNSEAVRRDRVA